MTALANTETSGMKNEQALLNLVCVVGAVGLFAFVGYNLFAAGAVISTDGLFFTVVPTVIAFSLLAMPAQQFLSRRLEKRRIAKGEITAESFCRSRTCQHLPHRTCLKRSQRSSLAGRRKPHGRGDAKSRKAVGHFVRQLLFLSPAP